MAMTPEELAMLTDEEREGLEDDEETEGEDTGDETGGDNDGDGGQDDQGEDGQDADGEPQGEEQQPTRDDGQDDEPADEDRPVPLLQVKAVEDADAKLADIDKREDEFTQKFEDGDLTTAEYRAELRKLERERSTIENQQLQADLAAQMNEAQINARWEENVKLFLAEHPEVSKSEIRMGSFDTVVRKVTAETMNAGKQPGMADLKKAYAAWAEDLGIAQAKPEPKKPEAKPQAEKPRRDLPPALHKMPAADIQDTDNGKWAHLDRLMETDPIAFEAALAKLPDAEQEAYMASA